jgi:DNA-directed RNA polymerase subunit M/transcription elongation factor TFIIS
MNTTTNYISPYSYKNYDFITEKASDIKNEWIRYAKNNINIPFYQKEIFNEINDIKKAIKIEKSIFEFALVFCKDNACDINMIPDVYTEKFNFIISNIRKDPKINNNTLNKSIINGQFNLQFIAFLSPSQIHPENWVTHINKINSKEERESKIEHSDIYKCKRCKECKSSVTQRQSRCADEPPTTYVLCLVCGYGFKF